MRRWPDFEGWPAKRGWRVAALGGGSKGGWSREGERERREKR